GSIRSTVTPGVSSGTRIIDCCSCLGASGSFFPITMASLQRGSPTPDDHHLRPLITYSSPSLLMLALILVASLEATSGSVMEKHDLISPANSGSSHSFFCFSDPYRSKTSMLPVSGALQLKTSGPIMERPIISQSGAYSRFESPAPYVLSGRNRFHKPFSLAFCFNSSIIGGTADHRFSCSFSCSL